MVEGLNEIGTLMTDFQTKDFPEHGIKLIALSNPSRSRARRTRQAREIAGRDERPFLAAIKGLRVTDSRSAAVT